ncbi:hypothetical protein HYT52_04130 [Candidatus Woesearchaeota archaeon]|nr:hypothetical protein [Candidatus Woesearchaeota archaeon]
MVQVMPVKHHHASYQLGERELRPDERIVVSTRIGPSEPLRIADHLGVSPNQPAIILEHILHEDGLYIPTFATKRGLDGDQLFARYVSNYVGPDGERIWGQGLKGRTVYVVHVQDDNLTAADLNTRVLDIAGTCKYLGADAVVLLAYTLDHDAQERGVHDTTHPRMQTDAARARYDGQGKLLEDRFRQYLTAGYDAIIVPQIHAEEEALQTCADVNEEFAPMHQRALDAGSNHRYHLKLICVDLAPVVSMLITDYGTELGIDLSDGGRNVVLINPDAGITGFGHRVRTYTELPNIASAVMKKTRAADGKIEHLTLEDSIGLSPERGIEGMHVFMFDDRIRTGATMGRNIEALCGGTVEGLERDPRIKGKPASVTVYTTRTNLAGYSRDVLGTPFIDHLLIANGDPRAFSRLGSLAWKTQMPYINFLMAEAAKCAERGVDPNSILTPSFIRSSHLLRVERPHGHRSTSKGSHII